MYFKRKELEKFRSFKGPLIDVRSPSEYYKGHMPNSINIPLFDNDERSIIGTIYKKEGRKKAVIEGLKFFEKKMELLLDNLFISKKFGLYFFKTCNSQPAAQSSPLLSKISNNVGPSLKIFSISDSI